MTDRSPRTPDDQADLFQTYLDLPSHRLFGLRLLSAKEGVSQLTFETSNAALVPGGYVHGGVSSLLMEPAAMIALVTVLAADRWTVTSTSEYRMLRAVPQGSDVLLEGRVARVGRHLAHVDVALTIDGVPHVEGRFVKSIIPA
ncbi:MAG: hypothetical protein CMK09_16740 [Ponticaulis sp.]|nr:hypothetical protein [Ponticaulis sp.]|tara:strand:+ start:10147 stop:10575 length:429 start_codon:yes stop_codon:yes gene_type:complete